MRIRSFAPIVSAQARVLILGSIPGEASLRAGQYYGHPRNAFWPIIGQVLGISTSLAYNERVAQVRARGVSIWDVLHSCVRQGSLDADIAEDSIRANNFAHFFTQYPGIKSVYFNGSTAEIAYRRHVLPGVSERFPLIRYTRLPSTSPANASYTLARKIEAWSVIADRVGLVE